MYNIYNICLSDYTTLEVAAESEKEALRKALYPTNVIGIYAIPVKQETLLKEDELDYTHALGEITYIVKHMVDADGCYYTVEVGEASERLEEIDDESMLDIRHKLTHPTGLAYDTMDEVKKAIMETIDDTYDIYEGAIKY